MIRSRLFIKVYLTLLATLAAVAIASGLYWRATIDRDDISWGERRDRFLAEMLPVGDDPAFIRTTLERLAAAFDSDIALYAADGRLLAAAGNGPPPTPERSERRRLSLGRDRDRPLSMRLDDGRMLVARIDAPWGHHRGFAPLGYLALIAAVIGIAAYPVVHHLTRRLEILREGVENFGRGALLARVPVHGRDEIAAVAKSFNAAADRIERLVTAHRALLANASHELRSPVTRLRMAIDLYEKPQDGAARAEILDNLGEIDHLVDEILLASRLDHVTGLERSERVDLMALAAEECARHGVEVAGAPAEIMGDPRLLTRLIRNLLLNAMRHGRPPVTVEVRAEGERVLLSVRDHGNGLPTGEEARIFEPFYRPSGRSESSGGWGLGLALVRQIAEHHGGTVSYDAPLDGGARFVVQFPRGFPA